MSSTKRRINSTGRKRISRECIEINMLESVPGDPLKATVTLRLSDLGFPDNALVAIEAYHRSSGMRFDCGTIENLRIPNELVLNDIDRAASVMFRLKVIDNNAEPGKLIGSAERLAPKSEGDSEGRRSLFPIEYRDMRSDVWKVEIEHGSRPVLLINNRIRGFRYKLKKDPILQGLMLPAALRFVLQELVIGGDAGEDEEEPGWKEEWLDYCNTKLGQETDPREFRDAHAKEEWVDDAVKRFCESWAFVDKMGKLLESES